MKQVFLVFSFIALLCALSATEANGEAFQNNLSSIPLGELTDQNGWSISKFDPKSYSTISVSASDTASNDKYIEIINNKSLLASQLKTPVGSGLFEFKARHNKNGLFYLYAQTSDNGGQLLFSIQFTETNGILLEEGARQITLLDEYTADQWYLFSIDFANNRGDHGTFFVQIDGVDFGEYEYVKSESGIFDFAQITIGSETTARTAVSAFADSFSATVNSTTSTASADLLQLSISLSSTSISSNLENGLIVTATLDGIASIATSTLETESTSTGIADLAESTSTSETIGSTVGSFLIGLVESVVDIFTGNEPATTTTETTDETQPKPAPDLETESPPTDQGLAEPITVEALPEVPTEETSTAQVNPDNAVQSSISSDDTSTNEITTSTF